MFKVFKKFLVGLFVMLFSAFFGTNFAFAELSLWHKIGQMIVSDIRYLNNGKEITQVDEETRPLLKKLIGEYGIGSIVLFGKNFVSKAQSKKLISDLQDIAKKYNLPPLLIFTDQEGGKVERFAFDRERLKNNSDIKSVEEAYTKAVTIARELKEIGVNVDLAPVVDINNNPKNPVIGVRSFGADADVVSEFGVKSIQGLHSEGVAATAKHFPGHGNTASDSHYTLPVVYGTLNQLKKLELRPFKAAIDAGVDFVMSAHISLPDIDSTKIRSKKDDREIVIPATLSKKIMTDILRKDLGFKGVSMTDALEMKAISDHFSNEDACIMAIKAGNDLLSIPVELKSLNDLEELKNLYNKIIEDIKSTGKDKISEKKINESLERILSVKNKYTVFS